MFSLPCRAFPLSFDVKDTRLVPMSNTPAFLCGSWLCNTCCWPQWSQPRGMSQLGTQLVHPQWMEWGWAGCAKESQGGPEMVRLPPAWDNTVPVKPAGYRSGKGILNCPLTAHKGLRLNNQKVGSSVSSCPLFLASLSYIFFFLPPPGLIF